MRNRSGKRVTCTVNLYRQTRTVSDRATIGTWLLKLPLSSLKLRSSKAVFKQLGKDVLILEVFLLWLHPTKHVPNHYFEHDVQYFCTESTENDRSSRLRNKHRATLINFWSNFSLIDPMSRCENLPGGLRLLLSKFVIEEWLADGGWRATPSITKLLVLVRVYSI